jgi:hypothetical protein
VGQAAQLLRSVLTPLGERYGLDYNVEMYPGEPATSWEARAYRFLSAGAWLLLVYAEPDDFPATKRRARKRGANRLARSLRAESGQRATVFLTQAMGIYMAETLRFRGEDESAAIHDGFIELVQSRYPLSDQDRATLTAARDRLRGLEIGLLGAPPLDEEPDDDLRERRFWGAQDFFRTTMDFEGIRIALGDEEMTALDEHLRHPGRDLGWDALVRSDGDASWWLSAAENWSEAADTALA